MVIFSALLAFAAIVGVVGASPVAVNESDSALLVKRAPIRIMVVGDFISQGYAGDYTWRYRLWEWLRAGAVDVDFVGPYSGTFSAGAPVPLHMGPRYRSWHLGCLSLD